MATWLTTITSSKRCAGSRLGEAEAVMRFPTERDILARALPVAGLG